MSPPRVGTTKYVHTRSCVLSSASRSAGTCPRPTKSVSFIVVRLSRVDCYALRAVVAQPFARNERYGCGISLTGAISRRLPLHLSFCNHSLAVGQKLQLLRFGHSVHQLSHNLFDLFIHHGSHFLSHFQFFPINLICP